MANRAYLMNHFHSTATTTEASGEACLLGANYQLPIFWVALFEAADLSFVSVPCLNDDGEGFAESITTLFAPTAKVIESYAKRRASLAAALGIENAGYIAEWEEFLSSHLTAPMDQLDLGELWGMYENHPDFELNVRDYLSGVDDPTAREWGILCS